MFQFSCRSPSQFPSGCCGLALLPNRIGHAPWAASSRVSPSLLPITGAERQVCHGPRHPPALFIQRMRACAIWSWSLYSVGARHSSAMGRNVLRLSAALEIRSWRSGELVSSRKRPSRSFSSKSASSKGRRACCAVLLAGMLLFIFRVSECCKTSPRRHKQVPGCGKCVLNGFFFPELDGLGAVEEDVFSCFFWRTARTAKKDWTIDHMLRKEVGPALDSSFDN